MELNRRQMIAASSAVAALPLLPRVAYASRVPIEWAPGALGHPQEALVGSWIVERLKEKVLYTRAGGMGFPQVIKLTDPKFVVAPGGKVWNWMTGDTNEVGLTITIFELGVEITDTKIYTSRGVMTYFEHTPKEELEKYPLYFVATPFFDYEDEKRIKDKLPKGHIDYDMRWFEAYSRREKLA